MMKNEERLVESAIRYWLTFSDLVLIFNHHSTDGTGDILDALCRELPERVLFFQPDYPVGMEYIQETITNDMIHQAFCTHNADVVLPLDTDEFPFCPEQGRTVRELLCSLDQNACYITHWVYFGMEDGKEPDYSRFLPLSFPLKKKEALVQSFPKVILTRKTYLEDPVSVISGNHSIYRSSGNPSPELRDLRPVLYYGHYMFQGVDQFKAKNAIGWLTSYCRDAWEPGIAYHKERCVEKMLTGAEITNSFINQFIFSDFWNTEEKLEDMELECIDPTAYFPEIPLKYTEQYMQKREPFLQLLHVSLALAKQYKQQREQLSALTEQSLCLEGEKQQTAEALAQAQEREQQTAQALVQAREREQELAEELAQAHEQISLMERSLSLRLGRTLTWGPRKLRGGINCLRENGPHYTFNRTLEHLKGRK